MIVSIEREGRKYKVQVPDGAPEHTWQYGIVIGPPDMTSLGLPASTTTRLHNELFNRGLISQRDVRKKSNEVFGALQAAFSVDTSRIIELYS